MSLISRASSLWRNLVHRDRIDRDLDAEIGSALELIADEKMRAGLSPEQARRAATLEFGHRESVMAQVRDFRT